MYLLGSYLFSSIIAMSLSLQENEATKQNMKLHGPVMLRIQAPDVEDPPS